ncbi:unnamed protein product, partial [Nesidiocoris tenuis]
MKLNLKLIIEIEVKLTLKRNLKHIPNRNRSQTHNETENQTHNRNRSQTHNRNRRQSHNETETETHNRNRSQTHSETETQTHNRNRSQTHSETETQTHNRNRSQTHNETETQTHNRNRSHSHDETESQFDFDYEFEIQFHCEFDFDFDYDFEFLFHCEFDFDFDCEFEFLFHFEFDFDFDCEFEFLFHCEFHFDFDYEFEIQFHCEFDFDFDYDFEFLFHCEIDFDFDCEFEILFHCEFTSISIMSLRSCFIVNLTSISIMCLSFCFIVGLTSISIVSLRFCFIVSLTSISIVSLTSISIMSLRSGFIGEGVPGVLGCTLGVSVPSIQRLGQLMENAWGDELRGGGAACYRSFYRGLATLNNWKDARLQKRDKHKFSKKQCATRRSSNWFTNWFLGFTPMRWLDGENIIPSSAALRRILTVANIPWVTPTLPRRIPYRCLWNFQLFRHAPMRFKFRLFQKAGTHAKGSSMERINRPLETKDKDDMILKPVAEAKVFAFASVPKQAPSISNKSTQSQPVNPKAVRESLVVMQCLDSKEVIMPSLSMREKNFFRESKAVQKEKNVFKEVKSATESKKFQEAKNGDITKPKNNAIENNNEKNKTIVTLKRTHLSSGDSEDEPPVEMKKLKIVLEPLTIGKESQGTVKVPSSRPAPLKIEAPKLESPKATSNSHLVQQSQTQPKKEHGPNKNHQCDSSEPNRKTKIGKEKAKESALKQQPMDEGDDEEEEPNYMDDIIQEDDYDEDEDEDRLRKTPSESDMVIEEKEEEAMDVQAESELPSDPMPDFKSNRYSKSEEKRKEKKKNKKAKHHHHRHHDRKRESPPIATILHSPDSDLKLKFKLTNTNSKPKYTILDNSEAKKDFNYSFSKQQDKCNEKESPKELKIRLKEDEKVEVPKKAPSPVLNNNYNSLNNNNNNNNNTHQLKNIQPDQAKSVTMETGSKEKSVPLKISRTKVFHHTSAPKAPSPSVNTPKVPSPKVSSPVASSAPQMSKLGSQQSPAQVNPKVMNYLQKSSPSPKQQIPVNKQNGASSIKQEPIKMPPSSITVSKITAAEKAQMEQQKILMQRNNSMGLDSKRPSLEIMLVNAPKKGNETNADSKPVEVKKVIRPTPPSIPLSRLKNFGPKGSPPPLVLATNKSGSATGEDNGALDLSGKSSRKSPEIDSMRNLLMLSNTAAQERMLMTSLEPLKIPIPPAMNMKPGFQQSQQQPRSIKPGPNQNVRQIPNPSALMFRQHINNQRSVPPSLPINSLRKMESMAKNINIEKVAAGLTVKAAVQAGYQAKYRSKSKCYEMSNDANTERRIEKLGPSPFSIKHPLITAYFPSRGHRAGRRSEGQAWRLPPNERVGPLRSGSAELQEPRESPRWESFKLTMKLNLKLIIEIEVKLTLKRNLKHIPNRNRSQTHNETENQTHNRNRSQTHNRNRRQSHNETETETHNRNRSQTHSETETQTHNRNRSQTHSETETQTHNRNRSQTHNETETQTHNRNRSHSHDETESQFDFDYEFEIQFHCEFDFDFDYDFEFLFHCEFDFDFDCEFEFLFHFEFDFDFDCEFEFLFHCEFHFDFDYEFEIQFHCEFDFDFDYDFEFLFHCEIDFDFDCEFEILFHCEFTSISIMSLRSCFIVNLTSISIMCLSFCFIVGLTSISIVSLRFCFIVSLTSISIVSLTSISIMSLRSGFIVSFTSISIMSLTSISIMSLRSCFIVSLTSISIMSLRSCFIGEGVPGVLGCTLGVSVPSIQRLGQLMENAWGDELRGGGAACYRSFYRGLATLNNWKDARLQKRDKHKFSKKQCATRRSSNWFTNWFLGFTPMRWLDGENIIPSSAALRRILTVANIPWVTPTLPRRIPYRCLWNFQLFRHAPMRFKFRLFQKAGTHAKGSSMERINRPLETKDKDDMILKPVAEAKVFAFASVPKQAPSISNKSTQSQPVNPKAVRESLVVMQCLDSKEVIMPSLSMREKNFFRESKAVQKEKNVFKEVKSATESKKFQEAKNGDITKPKNNAIENNNEKNKTIVTLKRTHLSSGDSEDEPPVEMKKLKIVLEPLTIGKESQGTVKVPSSRPAPLKIEAPKLESPKATSNSHLVQQSQTQPKKEHGPNKNHQCDSSEPNRKTKIGKEKAKESALKQQPMDEGDDEEEEPNYMDDIIQEDDYDEDEDEDRLRKTPSESDMVIEEKEEEAMDVQAESELPSDPMPDFKSNRYSKSEEKRKEKKKNKKAKHHHHRHHDRKRESPPIATILHSPDSDLKLKFKLTNTNSKPKYTILDNSEAKKDFNYSFSKQQDKCNEKESPKELKIRLKEDEKVEVPKKAPSPVLNNNYNSLNNNNNNNNNTHQLKNIQPDQAKSVTMETGSKEKSVPLKISRTKVFHHTSAPKAPSPSVNTPKVPSPKVSSPVASSAPQMSKLGSQQSPAQVNPKVMNYLQKSSPSPKQQIPVNKQNGASSIKQEPIKMPPSSITVSKITAAEKAQMEQQKILMQRNNSMGLDSKRPSLEIMLVNAPKKGNETNADSKPVEVKKVIRPTPPSIPLSRLKNFGPKGSPPPLVLATNKSGSATGEDNGALDLSGKSSRKSPEIDSMRNLLMLSNTAAQERMLMTSLEPLKIPIPPAMNMKPGFQQSQQQPRSIKPGPNQNVRQIPNPSALMFRQHINNQRSVPPSLPINSLRKMESMAKNINIEKVAAGLTVKAAVQAGYQAKYRSKSKCYEMSNDANTERRIEKLGPSPFSIKHPLITAYFPSRGHRAGRRSEGQAWRLPPNERVGPLRSGSAELQEPRESPRWESCLHYATAFSYEWRSRWNVTFRSHAVDRQGSERICGVGMKKKRSILPHLP